MRAAVAQPAAGGGGGDARSDLMAAIRAGNANLKKVAAPPGQGLTGAKKLSAVGQGIMAGNLVASMLNRRAALDGAAAPAPRPRPPHPQRRPHSPSRARRLVDSDASDSDDDEDWED